VNIGHYENDKGKKVGMVKWVINFVVNFAQDLFALLFKSPDERNLMLFFLINFTFAFVELTVGYWSKSLSLQSDAWHMFNDSMATFWACVATVVAKWPKRNKYRFGYKRIEVLFAFGNCIFLIAIALNIFSEAIDRLFYHPEELHHDHLLVTSVAGLVVNLLGVFAFSHAHAHSHGSGGCPHSHGGEGGNVLLSSVYVHMLADTGGSVAVIIAGQLDKRLGWSQADPICSVILAFLILYTVIDTIKATFLTLLQGTSESLEMSSENCRHQARQLEGVVDCALKNTWTLHDDKHFATLVCLVGSDLIMASLENLRSSIESIFGQAHIRVNVVFTINDQLLHRED